MEAVGLGTLKSKINALSHKVKVVIEHGVVICTSPCLHYLFIYCYTKHFRRNMFGIDFASSVGDQTLFGTDFSEGCCAARRVLRVFGNSKMHPFNMVIHFNCYNCIWSEFPEYCVLISLVKANWIKIGSGFASGT